MSHCQISVILFNHLRRCEGSLSDLDRASYNCTLCKFSCRGKSALLQHVRSLRHVQVEQLHQLQRRAEGQMDQADIGDIFQVVDSMDAELAESSETGNLEITIPILYSFPQTQYCVVD